MDLGAVNYLQWGKPKIWYIVAVCDAVKIENKICDIPKKVAKLKRNVKTLCGTKTTL